MHTHSDSDSDSDCEENKYICRPPKSVYNYFHRPIRRREKKKKIPKSFYSLSSAAPLPGYSFAHRSVLDTGNDITSNADANQAIGLGSNKVAANAASVGDNDDPWQTFDKQEGKIAFDTMKDAFGQEMVFYHEPPPPPTTDKGKIWDPSRLQYSNPMLIAAQGYDVNQPERHKKETYTTFIGPEKNSWHIANEVNEEMIYRTRAAMGESMNGELPFLQQREGQPVGYEFTQAIAYEQAAKTLVPTMRGDKETYYPGQQDASEYQGLYGVQESMRELDQSGHYTRTDRAWNYALHDSEIARADPTGGSFPDRPFITYAVGTASDSTQRQQPGSENRVWDYSKQDYQLSQGQGLQSASEPYRAETDTATRLDASANLSLQGWWQMPHSTTNATDANPSQRGDVATDQRLYGSVSSIAQPQGTHVSQQLPQGGDSAYTLWNQPTPVTVYAQQQPLQQHQILDPSKSDSAMMQYQPSGANVAQEQPSAPQYRYEPSATERGGSAAQNQPYTTVAPVNVQTQTAVQVGQHEPSPSDRGGSSQMASTQQHYATSAPMGMQVQQTSMQVGQHGPSSSDRGGASQMAATQQQYTTSAPMSMQVQQTSVPVGQHGPSTSDRGGASQVAATQQHYTTSVPMGMQVQQTAMQVAQHEPSPSDRGGSSQMVINQHQYATQVQQTAVQSNIQLSTSDRGVAVQPIAQSNSPYGVEAQSSVSTMQYQSNNKVDAPQITHAAPTLPLIQQSASTPSSLHVDTNRGCDQALNTLMANMTLSGYQVDFTYVPANGSVGDGSRGVTASITGAQPGSVPDTLQPPAPTYAQVGSDKRDQTPIALSHQIGVSALEQGATMVNSQVPTSGSDSRMLVAGIAPGMEAQNMPSLGQVSQAPGLGDTSTRTEGIGRVSPEESALPLSQYTATLARPFEPPSQRQDMAAGGYHAPAGNLPHLVHSTSMLQAQSELPHGSRESVVAPGLHLQPQPISQAQPSTYTYAQSTPSAQDSHPLGAWWRARLGQTSQQQPSWTLGNVEQSSSTNGTNLNNSLTLPTQGGWYGESQPTTYHQSQPDRNRHETPQTNYQIAGQPTSMLQQPHTVLSQQQQYGNGGQPTNLGSTPAYDLQQHQQQAYSASQQEPTTRQDVQVMHWISPHAQSLFSQSSHSLIPSQSSDTTQRGQSAQGFIDLADPSSIARMAAPVFSYYSSPKEADEVRNPLGLGQQGNQYASQSSWYASGGQVDGPTKPIQQEQPLHHPHAQTYGSTPFVPPSGQSQRAEQNRGMGWSETTRQTPGGGAESYGGQGIWTGTYTDRNRSEGGVEVAPPVYFDPSQSASLQAPPSASVTVPMQDPTKRGRRDTTDYIPARGLKVRDGEDVSSREAYAAGMDMAMLKSAQRGSDRDVRMLTDYKNLRSRTGDQIRGTSFVDPRTIRSVPPSPVMNFGGASRGKGRKGL